MKRKGLSGFLSESEKKTPCEKVEKSGIYFIEMKRIILLICHFKALTFSAFLLIIETGRKTDQSKRDILQKYCLYREMIIQRCLGRDTMSVFDTYFLMKEEDVIVYVKEKLSYFPPDAVLSCKEIGDGNLNYVFRVVDEKSGRSLIVKQAGDQLRISKEMTLTRDRGRIEAHILKLQGKLCPGLVPEVYLYDEVMSAIIMEDMIGHTMMRTGLVNHEIYPAFAEQISTFLVNTLLLTSDIVMDHQQKKELVREFINPELCDITENLVFGEPMEDYNGRNDYLPEMADYIEKHIYGDEVLKSAVAELKFRFMNDAQSLIHGDLHTGSIFINQEHTFVFDPEFAFFGPMGYDIGNVIANLFFAYANGYATIEDRSQRQTFCKWCLDTMAEVIDLFISKYNEVYDQMVTDPSAREPAFKEAYLRQILSDTAGYTGTECIRRIVGIAHNKDITLISSIPDRVRAEKTLLTFAKKMILRRDRILCGADYLDAAGSAIRTIDPANDVIGPELTILDYDTVNLDEEKHALVIIDQTRLPNRIEMLSLTAQEDIWDAIYLLKVRGAPAIGVAAAIGIYLAARQIAEEMTAASYDLSDYNAAAYDAFYDAYVKASDYLNSSRPTAVNLSWALRRMDGLVQAHKTCPVSEIVELLHKEAIRIREEDIEVCRNIGRYGLTLVKPGDGLLTHCNAGQLATVKYGTATAPMYLGHAQGYDFKIYCDETRPLLQGARLTSFELMSAGMDVTVLCDNMSASLMREGKVDAIFVGCDRVAANGDAANKIGTSMVALAARRYGVPFYVCAPTSTIDRNTATGADIVIEQRKESEVTSMWYKEPMVAEGIAAYNPAFDVTDQDLITGIVTEFGIAYPPYEQSFKEIFMKKEIKKTVEEIMDDLGLE